MHQQPSQTSQRQLVGLLQLIDKTPLFFLLLFLHRQKWLFKTIQRHDGPGSPPCLYSYEMSPRENTSDPHLLTHIARIFEK